MKYHMNLEQGTQEWLDARGGVITASVIKDILTPKFKIANNDKTRALAYTLAAQRITGRVEPQIKSYHLERGHTEELYACSLYSEHYAEVTPCGFIRNGVLGYSPDGLVGDDGLIEIKSRVPKYQVQTIINGRVPDEYLIQCQSGMMISERPWIDFVQYSNGMELYVERVTPDLELVGIILEATMALEQQIRELVDQYKSKAKGRPLAPFVSEFDCFDEPQDISI
jgi:predicted phage-related endonuclease